MTTNPPTSDERLFEGYVLREGENPADEDAITTRLIAFNLAHMPQTAPAPEEQRPLALYVYAPDERLVGGLVGRTHAVPFWLEVSILWVDEAERGRGLGRTLMARAEDEARCRGCRFARLATSDYQAPDFYAALGYTVYGRLEDCPPDETVFYLRKDL